MTLANKLQRFPGMPLQQKDLPPKVQEAVDRMAANGIGITPTVHTPCGLLVLVAFPNGDFKFKAELLPEGKELDFAITMLDTAKAQLEKKKAEEKLLETTILQASGALPRM